jgi:hypothetical protein
MPTPLTESHPQIAEQWHPTRNGDFTPDKTSAGSSKSVWWICPIKCEHGCLHEWKNTVSNRCREGWGGCPFCSKLKKKVCIHYSIVGTHPDEWLDSELITEVDSEDRDHIFIATKPELYDKHLALYMSSEEIRI